MGQFLNIDMSGEKTILGVDEAGRGPIVGPMVIVGALFKKSDEVKLKKIGVKDSKLLTPKKREELFPTIKGIAKDYKVIEVSPAEIDQRFSVNINLNKLEAVKYAELINDLKPDIAIIDCPSPNTKSFAEYLSQFIEHKCELVCENYADKNYLEVGAASIIAKVVRDSRIAEIQKAVGMPIGVGYTHDKVTLGFVEKALKNKEWLNKYVRKSWLTFQNIKDKKEQKKLGDFEE
jgi:ribonuclease HII